MENVTWVECIYGIDDSYRDERREKERVEWIFGFGWPYDEGKVLPVLIETSDMLLAHARTSKSHGHKVNIINVARVPTGTELALSELNQSGEGEERGERYAKVESH